MEKELLLQQHEILKAEYVKLLNDKDILLSWGKPQFRSLVRHPYRCASN